VERRRGVGALRRLLARLLRADERFARLGFNPTKPAVDVPTPSIGRAPVGVSPVAFLPVLKARNSRLAIAPAKPARATELNRTRKLKFL
jgi:hypothetical protein